jgi:hypothetical protein
MSLHFNPPLTAKRPGNLVTVAVCRISTIHQDALSLDDQLAQHQLNVTPQFTGTIEWIPICSRGSGQYLDTKEILELIALIESGRIDLEPVAKPLNH